MKIGIYCYPVADILAKKKSEIFIEWSSTKHKILVQTLDFIGCHGNRKIKFAKKYFIKSTPQKL